MFSWCEWGISYGVCRLRARVKLKTLSSLLKDVRAHCYCASLVRTLRHVFQARALSRNSTKYKAADLCGNLICECFCWMLGDPNFFFWQTTSFSYSIHYTKKQKNLYVGRFNYFSYTIQMGSN